jgi:hypothetical protein
MEPITLGGLGAAALTEGIKFLYSAAGEALKRWWARKDARADSASELVDIQPPEVVMGTLEPLRVDVDALQRLEGEVEQLWAALSPYAQGRQIDAGDERLLTTTDALRRALEAVYQQRITFHGEDRPPSGPVVSGEIDADVVAGTVGGVIAETIEGGATVEGAATVREVEEGGSAAGVRAKRIGP